MSDVAPPQSVHLVGSIGLDTVEEVYRTLGGLLGPYLRRVPDGESAAASSGSAGNIRCCAPARICGPIRPAPSGRPTASRC